MRKGDIVVNPWVSTYFNGELNPNYATIYLGDNKTLDYEGRVCEWADKIYKDNPKRETPWKVIGHIDLYGIAELAIRDAVFDEENKDEPNSSEKPNSSDTISRQAAIGIVEFECGEWSGLAKTIAEEIKQMPSAQPERKNGAWINEGRIIRCNRCKIGYATVKGMKSALTYKFCPNCGCRMKGADDE